MSIRKRWLRVYKSIQQRLIIPMKEEELANPALVFSPHQDDETLGCGGTIIKKINAGARVTLVFMTNGSSSHRKFVPENEMSAIRAAEAKAASRILGIKEEQVIFLDFLDGQLKRFEKEAVEKTVSLLEELQPRQIFVPYADEPPADHAATYRIVMAGLKKAQIKATVYEYPIWFWDQWPWTERAIFTGGPRNFLHTGLANAFGIKLIQNFKYYFPIADALERKKAALSQYRSQMTRLVPDPGWRTLGDIAQGEFLECFFQEQEVFRRSEYPNLVE